jgi:O-antigen ligase
VREAHNDWLEIVAELGLVGLALGLMLVGAWLRWARGARAWRYSPGREAGLALVALAMLAVIDFPAANPAVVITALVLLAVVVELARNRSISA